MSGKQATMSEDTTEEPWTVLRMLNWTTDFFRDRGIENPRLNAELLLGEVLDLDRIMLYAEFERNVTEKERREYRELVRKRASRRPLQYLLGEADFYGRSFEVEPSVMVPRTDTEVLVEVCLEKIPEGDEEWRLADICCGSGVVGITLAAERPGLQVSAVDSQPDALSLARRNAERHDVAERITFLEGSLAEPLPDDSGCDLLASNPPYVPTDRIDTLQPEVSEHEPKVALDGGPDGLDVVRELVPGAAQVLRPGGWMALEIGEEQAEDVLDIVRQSGAFRADDLETAEDAAGHRRVIAVPKED